jgi:protein involved in polysaccharide export with SLBB domain
MAGGVTLNADLSQIDVRRGQDGDAHKANLWQMLKEGAGDEDIWLQSGDAVFVPALAHGKLSAEDSNLLLSSTIGPSSFPVRIIGEVTTPGIYDLTAASPYLNSAIAKAGGYKTGATREMLAIRRLTSRNTFNTLYVNPEQQEIVLQPNDIVFVAEKGIYKAGRFFETVAKVFAPFNFLPFVLLN